MRRCKRALLHRVRVVVQVHEPPVTLADRMTSQFQKLPRNRGNERADAAALTFTKWI